MSDTASNIPITVAEPRTKGTAPGSHNRWQRLWISIRLPLLAILTAFIVGGIVIWLTSWITSGSLSGSFQTVVEAYTGLFRGAFTKQRGLSESLVATVPYILLSLAVAVGFKAGLFNIGAEGQFFIGAICAAWAGVALRGLPTIVHLPLTIAAGALGGAIWAGVPGYLKAKTGAHEVITTMMLNYVAFRLVEYLVSGPLKDKNSTATQTIPVPASASLWKLAEIPARLSDPLNALGVALGIAFVTWLLFRFLVSTRYFQDRIPDLKKRGLIAIGAGVVIGVLAFFILPPLTKVFWPFKDQYDRLHVGLLLALFMAVLVWWLLWKTTRGFELRTVGANSNAARYAGVNITRNIVFAMAFSGALAGIAGVIEVLGVYTCRCLPLFFSSGYGFDSIAIALLAKNNPFGIVITSFFFGAMRNGADLMELTSGVSKYIISLIQALMLLFVAAPAIVRWLYRLKERPAEEEEAVTIHGWGG